MPATYHGRDSGSHSPFAAFVEDEGIGRRLLAQETAPLREGLAASFLRRWESREMNGVGMADVLALSQIRLWPLQQLRKRKSISAFSKKSR
jgi:hypothetical protein